MVVAVQYIKMPNLNSYEILTSDLLDHKDRDKIMAVIANVRSPSSPLEENFALKYLDHYGRVAIVTFRGMEVMLLFKRMTSKMSILELGVGNQAFLKNSEEAWISYPLISAYTRVPLADRVLQLEVMLKQKDLMLSSMDAQILELERDNQILRQRKLKKDNKAMPVQPKAVPMASADINEALLKIGPLKLQDVVRKVFLWSQGFDDQLVQSASATYPDVPIKYRKKVSRHISKLTKALKKARLEKTLVPYEVRKPKEKKKKTAKVVKSQVVKKVAKKYTTKKKVSTVKGK